MDLLKKLLVTIMLAALPVALGAAVAGAAHEAAATVETSASHAVAADGAAVAHAQAAHHGIPAAAQDIFSSLPITSSMVVTWVVVLFIILLARLGTSKMREVPEGLQNFWEWLVESLYEFLEGIIGPELVKRTFWFFGSLFIFILFANWLSLIPGVGTIGWGQQTEHGFAVTTPLLRGVNADLNMTFAMAIVFFALWTVWAIQVNGFKGFILHIFGPKGDTTGALKVMMIIVFLFVGLLETISILFRPISLSFRLYGNIYAGENMLESMAALISEPAWLKAAASVAIPIPFYLLEVLVGLVQALVFMLLTSVFTLLICTHEEGHEKGHH